MSAEYSGEPQRDVRLPILMSEEEQKQLEDKTADQFKKFGIESYEDLIDMFEDNEWEILHNTFLITKIMGSGGFGVVLGAIDIADPK